jgi:hypothetical protein
MPHSIPLPGPSKPQVNTVGCPLRNTAAMLDGELGGSGAPCAMMLTLPISTR